jgi:hypothetical protein
MICFRHIILKILQKGALTTTYYYYYYYYYYFTNVAQG